MKFNPEGVKGKTATPPHNFFKIMANGYFDITLSVKDANTRIELYEVGQLHIKARCESIAVRKAIKEATDNIRRAWRVELYNECCLFGPHKLTAKQLWGLVDAGYIKQPNDKVIEFKYAELVCWEPGFKGKP